MPVIELKPSDGKETKRKFDRRDWAYCAEYIIDEYETRKSDREDIERCWDDIDRQIAMDPQVEFKKTPDGRIDTKKRWMAETELPLQAQAQEVINGDIRRMLFPVGAPWFRAHAEMTDELLRSLDFKSLIPGDENEVPSRVNQDNLDKLVQGFLLWIYRQPFNGEDMFTRVDRINAEAIKYGMGVGRARMYARDLYIKQSGENVTKNTQRMPVLAPVSIRNLYLDNPKPMIHSLQVLEPAHIWHDHIKLENLQMAANRGSSDPDDEDGGWMPSNLSNIEADGDGYVELLEMEGDIVVPRKTVRSVVIPHAIITVVIGAANKTGQVGTNVVRMRYRKSPPSYILFPYQYESVDDHYPTSPLMKGRPVQMAATDALNRFLDAAMLKVAPPIGYDRTDQIFAQEGGPRVYPYAQWGTTEAIKVYTELGGDPSVLVGAMSQFVNLYAELTGVLPARLGAQTVSHTTAFAKNAELERGATRTVDYVNSIGQGALTRWLGMSYYMARDAMKPRESVRFWIDAYGGFVEVVKDQLPERCGFEWFGSGGPGEEQARRQAKLQSLALALQMDTMAIQSQRPPTVDIQAAIREVLREGGWTDLDAITAGQPAAATPTPAQNEGAQTLALLQQLPRAVAGG